MALASERTHREALPVPDEPLLSWSVYLAGTPAKWLGTIEAATPEEAFAKRGGGVQAAEGKVDGGKALTLEDSVKRFLGLGLDRLRLPSPLDH